MNLLLIETACFITGFGLGFLLGGLVWAEDVDK